MTASPSTPGTLPSSSRFGWLRPKAVVLLVVAVVAALAVGFLVGQRSSAGVKQARTVEGVAMLHDEAGGFASLDWGTNELAAFDAGSIWWFDGGSSGESMPPCLELNESVEVEAGVMRVAHPDGGWHTQVVWLRCL